MVSSAHFHDLGRHTPVGHDVSVSADRDRSPGAYTPAAPGLLSLPSSKSSGGENESRAQISGGLTKTIHFILRITKASHRPLSRHFFQQSMSLPRLIRMPVFLFRYTSFKI